MSKLGSAHFARKLHRVLGQAIDDQFFIMAWATHALQSGRSDKVGGYLKYPTEANTNEITSPHFIPPWAIETLLNEFLSASKYISKKNKHGRTLNCKSFSTIEQLYGILKKLENADDAIALRHVDVRREIHRLAQRQFEWQRGHVSLSKLYRFAFIYRGERAQTHFFNHHGFSMDEFTLACFIFRAIWRSSPSISRNISLARFGISDSRTAQIIGALSLTVDEARKTASRLRTTRSHMSYKPSILRQYPCISFGGHNDMIVAPIPDLVVLRATSGLFYDLAGGNAGIRNEVSDRFELYCTQLAKKILPSHDIERSFSYKFAGNQHDSPDVLVKTNKELRIIFECKAARMAYQARFAQNPLVDDPRGYKELAKGVFQIWRFVSHQRREESNEMVAHPDLVGVVLTLDTWLIMSAEIQNDVIEMAKVLLKERDPEILEKDLVPISFFSIADFEQTAERCSEDSFFDAVKGLSTSRFQGWQLYNVHKAVATEDARINSFPFEDRMSTVLPWWDKLPVRP